MSGSSIEIIEWKPFSKNTLRGFATIKLRNGLTIREVALHCSHGKRWASLPSKPMVDRDGNALKDRNTGKVRYSPILEWNSRDTADAFSTKVLEAMDEAHPGQVAE